MFVDTRELELDTAMRVLHRGRPAGRRAVRIVDDEVTLEVDVDVVVEDACHLAGLDGIGVAPIPRVFA